MSKDKDVNLPATKDKESEVNFPVLAEDPKELAKAIKANLEGMDLSPFDLDKITIPPGAGKFWTVPTLEGEVETKELLGIILGIATNRACWRQSLEESGGGQPPDCASADSKVGVGEPGGNCYTCPLNKDGSCRPMWRVFFLMPDADLPRVINLARMSIKPCKSYLLHLGRIQKYELVTRVTLAQDKSKKTSQMYSYAVFKPAGKLTAAQALVTEAMSTVIMGRFANVMPTAEDRSSVLGEEVEPEF